MDVNMQQQHYVPIVKSQEDVTILPTSVTNSYAIPVLPGQHMAVLPFHPPPKTKKPARDPGAPKRNLSAYLLYQNSMREHFKAQIPGMSFGQLSKYTSAMYAQLNPEEKAQWQNRADSDKARYELELASYCPPPGYDQRGDQIIIVPKHSKGKTGRDSRAPKRNVSAYLMFQNAMRDKIKDENPGISFGEVSKYTSQMYKDLTPEEKLQWDLAAQQDKQRYLAQISSYRPPPGHDARGVLMDPALGGHKRKRPKDPNAPKRNKGSFVLFAEEERPRLKQERPDIKFTDMGVILGERWRALSKEQKEHYEALANQEKIRFAQETEIYNRQHAIGNIPQTNTSMGFYPSQGVHI